MSSMTWVGLDVHKDSITAAVLEGDEARGTVHRLRSDLNQLRKLFRSLASRGSVRACYEAGGSGFVIQRALEHDGFHCEVVAPSLIPVKPGDRRKTDRRDALELARLYRSGHLTCVEVPGEEQEAVRTLVRTRLAFLKQIRTAKQRIGGLLLRQGLVFREGKSYWTQKHRLWLAQQRRQLEGAEGIALGAELDLLEYLETQLGSLDAEIARYAQRPPFRAQADALCCLRGVRTLTAMTLVTEIANIRRFESPTALMSFVGLVPSEDSSGERQRRGAITRAGNVHLRRVLLEAAQNHCRRASSTLVLQRRRQGQPAHLVAIALKAQHRLHRRYWHLALRKHHNVAVTAVARELCGFVWALMYAATEPVPKS